MKSFAHSHRGTAARVWLLIAFAALAVAACVFPFGFSRASNPPSGTIAPTSPTPVTWTGTATGGAAPNGEGDCIEGQNCDTFKLNVSGTTADWVGKTIRVTMEFTLPSSDYDLVIYKGECGSTTGKCTGTQVAASGNIPGQPEAAIINPGSTGVGLYSIRAVYFAATAADQYRGAATVQTPQTRPTPPPASQASGNAPRFQVFTPPANILSRPAGQGGNGTDAGEPTLGANWKTGKVMYIAILTTFQVSFNDFCPTSPSTVWKDVSAPNTNAFSQDPILWTDNRTGNRPNRTIVSQLVLGANKASSPMALTDNDGGNTGKEPGDWIASQGSGINSGVDHQSVGGGPYRPGTFPTGNPTYPNAIYYCSQDIAAAQCARSDDGGLTFGPAVPMYNLTQCGGLHGHVKVADDGTVYVPNKGCSEEQAIVVSEDNGITWSVRKVKGSTASGSDPSLDIDRNGKVYFGYADADTIAAVAVSDDKGKTWKNHQNVGAPFNVNNLVFPAVVAGDAGRAAVAFLGTSAQGSPDDLSFKGLWYPYLAQTYDGGQTWFTVNLSPNDPVQRGPLWRGGGGPVHRNLLDFIDATLDNEGRVLVSYADGCMGGTCVGAPDNADGNAFTSVATIARQTGGRTLKAAFDATFDQTKVPGAPKLSAWREGGRVFLSWSQSDNGGLAVTSFNVYRSTSSGGAGTLVANVPASQFTFVDATNDETTTFFYRVTAVNALGESCGTNEVSVPFSGNVCAGIKMANDPANDHKTAPGDRDMDILSVSVGEPAQTDSVSRLSFKMKVADFSSTTNVPPPNKQWFIIWHYPDAPGAPNTGSIFTGRYYVAMKTNGTGVPSFEYGIIEVVDGVVTSVHSPFKIGNADSGSVTPDGQITINVANAKIGNPGPGDLIGTVVARTFDGSGDGTVSSRAAIDSTVLNSTDGTPQPEENPQPGTFPTPLFATYQLVGNSPSCAAQATPTPAPTATPAPGGSPTPTPTGTPTPTPAGASFQFDRANYSSNEGCTPVNITVTRTGSSTGAASVSYRINNGSATQRGDFTYATGTLPFADGETSKTFQVLLTDDGYGEGTESATVQITSVSGGSIASPSAASLTINDNETNDRAGNVIDDAATFVCQQYHDFLNRQPDESGQSFWTNQIASCGSDAACADNKRTNVSQAFFLSIEFQNTGYYVFRLYRASFPDSGQRPRGLPRYAEFLRDTQEVQRGVVVGQGNWQAQLEANKLEFARQWVRRPDFVAQYPEGMTREQYVDQLFSRSGVAPSGDERNAALAAYDSGDTLTEKRARALRVVVETGSVYNAQYNPAFVYMQYVGYLRRNPNDAPDNNFAGYDFWLNKMNQFSKADEDARDEQVARARVARAEMVRSFIVSGEYRGRFAGDASRGNDPNPTQVAAAKLPDWLAVPAYLARHFINETFGNLFGV